MNASLGARYVRPVLVASAPSFELWRASDLTLDRRVLVKLWRDASCLAAVVARERELADRGALNCMLVRLDVDRDDLSGAVTSYEDVDATTWLAADAGTLSERLARARSLGRAIEQIHRAGLSHGGLCPAHLLAGAERTYVVDFTRASAVRGRGWETDGPGEVGMDLRYAAPEQTSRAGRHLDHRADLYSFGLVLFELLTGQVPFSATDPLELAHQQRTLAPSWPSAADVPDFLRRIVLRLLEKDPQRRYQTAEGTVADLEVAASIVAGATVETLVIGRHDVPVAIEVTTKLYGRAAHREALLAALERTQGGGRTLVTLAGPSGVGKTSIIRDACLRHSRQETLFVAGKFDQLEPRVPYSGWLQVFDSLVGYVLAEPRERLDVWRARIRATVGPSANVLGGVVPRLEALLGSQPPPLPIPPLEAQQRFEQAVVHFARTFCRPEKSLVIFLDDAQWMDPASQRVLERLATDLDSKHLLLVLAYRDNEVPASHPFAAGLERLRGRLGASMTELCVAPLAAEHIRELLRDTFESDADATSSLAALLDEKTGGNPFFIWQLLKTVRENGLLGFDPVQRTWIWNLDAIAGLPNTESVVTLIIRRLEALPPPARETLAHAACIGGEFDVELVARMSGRSIEEAYAALSPSIDEDFLKPRSRPEFAGGASFVRHLAFAHDRIQEAAYALLDADGAARVHARAAREMLARPDAQARVFEIADQFERAGASVDETERTVRIRTSLAASRTAAQATAFDAALRYAGSALAALPPDAWQRDAVQAREVHIQLGQMESLAGNHEAAERVLRVGVLRETDKFARAEFYLLLVTQYTLRAAYSDAIEAARAGLALFGVQLPTETEGITERALATLDTELAGRGLDVLGTLPEMEDLEQRATLRLLLAVGPPCYRSQPAIWSFVVVDMIRRILRHGVVPGATYAFPALGGLLMNAGRGTGEGCRLLEQATASLMARLETPADVSVGHLMIGSSLRHWFAPLELATRDYLAAYERGFASGNLQYAAYGFGHNAYCGFFRNLPLADLVRDVAGYETFAISRKNLWGADLTDGVIRVVETLRGAETAFARRGSSEDDFVARCRRHGNQQPLVVFRILKAEALWHLGDLAGAARELNLAEPDLPILATQGLLPSVQFGIVRALLVAVEPRNFGLTGEEGRQVVTHEAARARRFAASSATVFEYAAEWLEAELARMDGDVLLALERYGRALDEAQRLELPGRAALIATRVAELWEARGARSYAASSRSTALAARARWGMVPVATAGLGAQTTLSRDRIEIQGLLRAAQDVSRSVNLEDVIQSIVASVSRVSGAQRTVLLVADEGELEVVADTAAGPMARMSNLESARLPRGILQFVLRTGEPFRVERGEIVSDPIVVNDPYLREHAPASLLCVPLELAGTRHGVLYLEHAESANVFRSELIELIELLGGHGAVALRNAELVSKLRSSLGEKTALLQEVHHRVKNNLQVVISLIRMQASQIKDGVARAALLSCQDRVRSMALVHEMLYQSEGPVQPGFHEYARRLATSILSSSATAPGQIELLFDLERTELVLEQAIPCGLILNELITNALKHAFVGDRSGVLVLKLHSSGDTHALSVRDDGVEFPSEAANKPGSLGLQIVDALVAQLEGEMRIERDGGTLVEITFPVAEGSRHAISVLPTPS